MRIGGIKMDKSRKNNNIIEILTNLFFSIFLSYITVFWSLESYTGRTTFFFIVFIGLYYLIIPKILKFRNPLLLFFLEKDYKKNLKVLDDAHRISWLILSSVVGIGAFIIFTITLYYIYLKNKFFLEPDFYNYQIIVENLPFKIYIIALIGFTIFVLFQILILWKTNAFRKFSTIVSSFFYTVLIIFIMGFLLVVGIYAHYVLAGLLLVMIS